MERTSRADVEQDEKPEVVSLEDASDVFDALSSATARTILEAVYERPGTASDIANRADTSVQNASYHLENLCDVDLIEISHQRPTDGGRPLSVYEPSEKPLVLLLGTEDTSSVDSVVRRGERVA